MKTQSKCDYHFPGKSEKNNTYVISSSRSSNVFASGFKGTVIVTIVPEESRPCVWKNDSYEEIGEVMIGKCKFFIQKMSKGVKQNYHFVTLCYKQKPRCHWEALTGAVCW